MRKDVHVGLAIGGVLLAVLIVWGVVVSGQHKAKQTVALDTQNTASPGGSEIPPPSMSASSDTHAGDNSGNHVSPAHAPNTATPADPGAATPGTGADPAPAPQVPDKKDVNWNALLSGDGKTSLMASNGDNAGGTSVTSSGPADTFSGNNNNTASSNTTGADSAARPAAARTHKIQSGETFSSIAQSVYGNKRYYRLIQKANPSIDPARLRPGMTITLPDVSDAKASTKTDSAKPDLSTATGTDSGDKTSATADSSAPKTSGVNGTEYRVASGDSLYKISQRLYGSPEEVDHIYDLNKSTIGPDRTRLKVGMVLKLPAAPTVASAR